MWLFVTIQCLQIAVNKTWECGRKWWQFECGSSLDQYCWLCRGRVQRADLWLAKLRCHSEKHLRYHFLLYGQVISHLELPGPWRSYVGGYAGTLQCKVPSAYPLLSSMQASWGSRIIPEHSQELYILCIILHGRSIVGHSCLLLETGFQLRWPLKSLYLYYQIEALCSAGMQESFRALHALQSTLVELRPSTKPCICTIKEAVLCRAGMQESFTPGRLGMP